MHGYSSAADEHDATLKKTPVLSRVNPNSFKRVGCIV